MWPDESVPASPPRIRLWVDPELVLRPITTADLAQSQSERIPRAPSRRSVPASITPNVDRLDCSDFESQRVLTAAACAVARELGRQAAREYFAEAIEQWKGSR